MIRLPKGLGPDVKVGLESTEGRILMRILISLAMMAIAIVPTLGDDVPYAARPSDRIGTVGDDLNSLGNVMDLTQLRHIKLWYAGRQQNWLLAGYELNQIEDTFLHAAMFYRHIPIGFVTSVERQLAVIQTAVDGKDSVAFAKGYVALTETCNACHKAAQVGFVVIQTPTASPFRDQTF